MLPADLVTRWREDAALLRERYADERGAALFEQFAKELQEALDESDNEVLSLSAASKESGYTVNHLGKLVAQGKIQNGGRKGAPGIRRRDLPHRPGTPEPVAPKRSDIPSIGLIGRKAMQSRTRG